MLPTLVAAAEPGVHAVYDMIGFAPRGVDPSSTVYCVYDSDGPWEPGFDSRERTSANLDAMARVSANEAKACSSHDLSPQITTQQTVRDLDLLRAVLRESKISYLGYSYGTWLGAWYAATFKSRVDRFVLDSNMIWTSTFQRAVGLQPLGFERRFGQFKAWAARHHDTYGLGETPMKVNDAWEAVRAAMPLGFRDFLNSVTAQTMYADQVWPPFAQWLKSMQEGRSVSAASLIADGVPRALAVRLARLSEPSGDPIAVPGAFPAIACGDTPWTKDPTHWREAGAIGEKYPLIGYHQSVQPCGYYPFTDPNRPAINVNTVPRMLMVQNELDPATPVEGAVVPWRGTGQRLIGVLRGGNHGVYAADLNPCVERRVNGYLINGVMPSYDVFCEALPLPGDDAPPGSSTFAGKAVRKVEPAGQPPSLDSTAALAAQRVAEMIMDVNPPR